MTKKNLEKKKVEITFKKPIVVEVAFNGESDKELLEKAKLKVIEQLKESFPRISYNILQDDTLTFDDCFVGKVVIDEENNKYAVITKINTKSVSVIERAGAFTGHPCCFKSADIKDYEKIMWSRDYLEFWDVGDLGFFAANTKKGKVVHPVIVTSKRRDKFQLFIIGGVDGKSSYYSVLEKSLQTRMFDTKKAAEKFLEMK